MTKESFTRGFFEDNSGRVDNEKFILHANRWYVYMNNKKH